MAYVFLPHSLCSGTVLTTIVLGDCSDHSHARDCLDRPRARGLSRLRLFSGIHRFPHAVLGDCPDHSRPLLGDCSPRLHVICTHIQLRGIYFFSLRPCYKADTAPFSKLRDYIGTMHLSVQFVSLVRRLNSQLNWKFFFRPYHHVPMSPTTRLED